MDSPSSDANFVHGDLKTRDEDNLVLTTQSPSEVHPFELGPNGVTLTCPYCGHEVKTEVKNICKGWGSWTAHLAAALLCLMGLVVCCICCPSWMDCCAHVEHTCSNCKNTIGTYRRYCCKIRTTNSYS